ncbi:MAG TPA: hypothetical protein VGC86_13960, partial [Afipia sp.]
RLRHAYAAERETTRERRSELNSVFQVSIGGFEHRRSATFSPRGPIDENVSTDAIVSVSAAEFT